MSATSEKLAEELRILDEKIVIAKQQHFDTEELDHQRKLVMEKLSHANEDLTEGKILKG